MKLVDAIALITFVHDPWSYAAFAALLVYFYFTRT